MAFWAPFTSCLHFCEAYPEAAAYYKGETDRGWGPLKGESPVNFGPVEWCAFKWFECVLGALVLVLVTVPPRFHQYFNVPSYMGMKLDLDDGRYKTPLSSS